MKRKIINLVSAISLGFIPIYSTSAASLADESLSSAFYAETVAETASYKSQLDEHAKKVILEKKLEGAERQKVLDSAALAYKYVVVKMNKFKEERKSLMKDLATSKQKTSEVKTKYAPVYSENAKLLEDYKKLSQNKAVEQINFVAETKLLIGTGERSVASVSAPVSSSVSVPALSPKSIPAQAQVVSTSPTTVNPLVSTNKVVVASPNISSSASLGNIVGKSPEAVASGINGVVNAGSVVADEANINAVLLIVL